MIVVCIEDNYNKQQQPSSLPKNSTRESNISYHPKPHQNYQQPPCASKEEQKRCSVVPVNFVTLYFQIVKDFLGYLLSQKEEKGKKKDNESNLEMGLMLYEVHFQYIDHILFTWDIKHMKKLLHELFLIKN